MMQKQQYSYHPRIDYGHFEPEGAVLGNWKQITYPPCLPFCPS